MTAEELMFFASHPGALPIYECLASEILRCLPDTEFEVRRTQISFRHRYIYGCASFLPVLRASRRPEPFLTVTFGLRRPVSSDRIAAVTEAQPGRWTHHVLVGSPEDIDGELMGMLGDAYEFSWVKR